MAANHKCDCFGVRERAGESPGLSCFETVDYLETERLCGFVIWRAMHLFGTIDHA